MRRRKKVEEFEIPVESVAWLAWLLANPDVLEAVVALGVAERNRTAAERNRAAAEETANRILRNRGLFF